MNDLLLVLVVGLVIVGLLFVLRSREASEDKEPGLAGSRGRDLLSQPVDPRALAVVMALLGRSRKVQAIQELMRVTGLGLGDAKKLSEAIQRGHKPPPTVVQGEYVDLGQPDRGPHSKERPGQDPRPSGADRDLAERARDLRSQGRETEAIRLVCDETGMGILDAQRFVRAL